MSLPAPIIRPALKRAERYAEIIGKIELVEAARAAALAKANQQADGAALPLLREAAEIKTWLEAFWNDNGGALTQGKRMTVELGGCTIGTKAGGTSLGLPEGGGVDALKAVRWGKPFVRLSYDVDKVAVRNALAGKHGAALAALGFCEVSAPASFVLKRVAQAGVIG